jgi:hypothetical protein
MNSESCPYKPRRVLTERQAMKENVGTFYHPTEKTFRTGACPEGYDLRKGYDRKSYRRKDGTRIKRTHVDPICVLNKGLPGKIANEFKPIKLDHEDVLKKFNYNTRLSSDKRFECLLNAVKELSYRSVVARVNAIRILTKANERLYNIYTTDLENLRKWRDNNPDLYKTRKETENIVSNEIEIQKNNVLSENIPRQNNSKVLNNIILGNKNIRPKNNNIIILNKFKKI